MEDELMFNMEDINISEESADFISENASDESDQGGSTEVSKEENENQSTDNVDDNDKIEVEDNQEDEDKASDEQASQEDTPSSDNDSSQNSTLYALAQYLKEEGVLFIEDELKDVKSLDDLKDLIKSSNERASLANLNESQRRYQEALKNGVPKSEFEEVEKEIQTFSNIKEEDVARDESLRYQIMAIDFMNQGINKDKAMKLAKLSLADESNVQDAREALKNIVETKTAKFKELVEKSKTSKDIQIDEVKKSVFEKEKLLDSQLNDTTKNKLFDLITTQVDSDEEGRPLNELQKWQRDNPVESSVMLNYLFMMTNKGKDLNLIKKSSTSKASKELERKLRNLSFDDNGSLIIPDQMITGKKSDNNNKSKNNLTINI